jgi:hypothetical protein
LQIAINKDIKEVPYLTYFFLHSHYDSIINQKDCSRIIIHGMHVTPIVFTRRIVGSRLSKLPTGIFDGLGKLSTM